MMLTLYLPFYLEIFCLQVTYPYIMAKIRIQARSADVDEYKATHEEKPLHCHQHHSHSKHVGAVTILRRVLEKEGITGWYQVRYRPSFSAASVLIYVKLGHGSSDLEGCDQSGVAVLVQGAVRALGSGDHGRLLQAAKQAIVWLTSVLSCFVCILYFVC
jgi:hypothetical protein